MIKIDAVVRENVLEELTEALREIEVYGMTITQVMGCGTQLGYKEKIRGSQVDVHLLPKIKFEIVVSSQKWADNVVDVICRVAYTGEPGDGKIFLYDLKDCVRIRTRTHGPKAVWAEGQTE